MGHQKKIPETDDARIASLSTTKNRIASVAPSDNIISEINTIILMALLPEILSRRIQGQSAEQALHSAVAGVKEVHESIKSRTSHGFQLVNFQIDDKIEGWSPDTRTLYFLNLDGRLPSMNSENEILQAAHNFIDGETARTTPTGTLLTDISKAQVLALLNDLDAKIVVRQDAKTALIEAQMAFDEKRAEADVLIPKLWGDIEHASQDMESGTAHDFNTIWGMQFEHVPGYGIVNVKVEDEDTHLILAGVELRVGAAIGKGGAKAKTNEFGVATIKSQNFNKTNLVAKLITHLDSVTDIQLIEDETINVVVKMKKI